MTLQTSFSATGTVLNQAQLALLQLESELRRTLSKSWALTTVSTPGIMGDFAAFLQQGHAAGRNTTPLAFASERVLSLQGDAMFEEQLIRLTGRDGQPVTPPSLFREIEAQGLSAPFRQWLSVAQIAAIGGHPGQSVSLNVGPRDIASEEYRETLDRALDLHARAGGMPVILELTEERLCSDDMFDDLVRIANRHGARIAIDDFGARDEDGDDLTLQNLARRLPPGQLMVKLDGPLVWRFLDGDDDDMVRCLDEIHAHCPDATIVAEWISSDDVVNRLREELADSGHRHSIHMVQHPRFVDDTPSELQARLAALPQAEPDAREPGALLTQAAPQFLSSAL